jgi:ABC-2 type transport system ATP-binding protein
MDNVIVAKSVYKTFKSGFINKKYVNALKDINITIKRGEIFGLLGPNGAGKTTLLNIFSGHLLPDKGQVWILGKEITTNMPLELKTRINMCSGNPNFPWSLTVEENLKFFSLLYNIHGSNCATTVDKYIKMFGLEKVRKTRYDSLSTGNKQRLALAKSLINNPEILYLDEPTIGLDPDIAKKIRESILRIHQETNMTIILTTHYMKEAEELCERISFIKDGEIKALGTKYDIMKLTKSENLEDAFIELSG